MKHQEDKSNYFGDLIDINTGEIIRPATAEEREESIEQARWDGGAGAISVDGKTVYVR